MLRDPEDEGYTSRSIYLDIFRSYLFKLVFTPGSKLVINQPYLLLL